MKKKNLGIFAVILVILVCAGAVSRCNSAGDCKHGRDCQEKCTAVAGSTDDCSQFVTITDVVPDVILEIRYYGTYNFVGARIDGYEQH